MTLKLYRMAAAGALAMLALAAALASAEAPDPWSGTYTYSEYGGRTAGGTGIVVTHEVAVTLENGRYRAEITANGYQTARHLFATGEVVGTRLKLSLEREGEEHMFKGQIRPGALLLEFERRTGRGVYTHWHAYTPATQERYANPGNYFRREPATRR